jgi:hypothetical protein
LMAILPAVLQLLPTWMKIKCHYLLHICSPSHTML